MVVIGVPAQTKNFIPVEGASLKAKIDNAVTQGRAGSSGSRFWVGYQFEARPGVAIDFEVVDSNGGVYFDRRNVDEFRFALRNPRVGGVLAL